MRQKSRFLFPILCTLVILFAIIIATSIGVVRLPVEVVFQILLAKIGVIDGLDVPQNLVMTIWELRFPRVVMSLFAGAALAICGVVFQSIFRNPICDPYILGISSGASLGAAVAFIFGWNVSLFGVTLPALATALLTLLLILGVAKVAKHRSTNTLLLAGVAINFLISAVITLLLVINQESMQQIIFWTMGSLATVSWRAIGFLLPALLVISFALFYLSKDLNIIQLGKETAQSVGVRSERVSLIALSLASILMAIVVSFCGVIGFIGLIVPHIVRLLVGNDVRRLVVYASFFGAFFLLFADTLARTLAAPSELPVGSITALAGAPYFIFLLLKKRKSMQF